jgi:hypothetical protein
VRARVVTFFALMLVIAVPTAGLSSVTTTNEVVRGAGADLAGSPAPGQTLSGSFWIERRDALTAGVSPAAHVRAGASYTICDSYAYPYPLCTAYGYSWQDVPSSSYRWNPVSSSAEFDVCLTPYEGGACTRFHIFLANPGGGPELGSHCGGQLVYWCVDVGADPAAAHFTFEGGPALVWYEYDVSGFVGNTSVTSRSGFTHIMVESTDAISVT